MPVSIITFFYLFTNNRYNKDMNNCTKCNETCNTSCGGGCSPVRYNCGFSISCNPYNPSIWNVTINGATTKVKIPKIAETDTKLSTSFADKSLIYNAEKHVDTITGEQIGSLINLADLRDVEADDADSCDLLVYHPFCSECGDGCTPKNATWMKYHIPDAGDTTVSVGDDGFYRVLVKSDCGCIKEDRLPVVPAGMIAINYMRDSVPDDPDFPWYYGSYNDTINLHLADNASEYFGKYALKVTVNYGIQAILSQYVANYNFRSLVVPVVAGEGIRVESEASILQGLAAWKNDGDRSLPWGSQAMRGSFTFYVPKGKEAYLHHEYRVRNGASFPNYAVFPTDGQKVPDAEATLNNVLYPASRLNALQIIVEPTTGTRDYDPAADAYRDQLDAPVDEYPNPV